MKTLNVLSAFAAPAFLMCAGLLGSTSSAESIATDVEFVTPVQQAPVIIPVQPQAQGAPAVVPLYVQNDVLLRNAYMTNDQILRKMIADQMRRQGGIQNFQQAQFRQQIQARLNLLQGNQNRPHPAVVSIDSNTEAAQDRAEIASLRSQIARLEARSNRSHPEVVSLGNQNSAAGFGGANQNNFVGMMMQMLAMMSQQGQGQNPAMFGGLNNGFGGGIQSPNMLMGSNNFGQGGFGNAGNYGGMGNFGNQGGYGNLGGYGGGFQNRNYGYAPSAIQLRPNVGYVNSGISSQYYGSTLGSSSLGVRAPAILPAAYRL